jgi:glycosyltransferase involved in cell wall biosynthesis
VADFRPDVVYATSPPPAAHFVTAGLRRELGVPLICELRDNWAGNPYYDADGRTLKRIEQRVLAPAAAVVVVTSAMASLMRALHPELADRLHVLPNGFDPRVLAFRESRRENTPGPLTLVHAGSIYGERTPEPVLAAMRRSPGRFRLVLAGAGSEMYGGAPDVEIRSAMPWEDAIKLQAAADIGVSLHSEDRTAQPGKLYELLALGKPILALVDEGNATHRLLESLGHGDGCVPHNDVDAIHAALTRLADDPPPPVLPERLEPWNRAAITKRLAALLDDVSK